MNRNLFVIALLVFGGIMAASYLVSDETPRRN